MHREVPENENFNENCNTMLQNFIKTIFQLSFLDVDIKSANIKCLKLQQDQETLTCSTVANSSVLPLSLAFCSFSTPPLTFWMLMNILVQVMLLYRQFTHFKVIKEKGTQNTSKLTLCEPVEVWAQCHCQHCSALRGEEDLPRCVSPDLEGDQLGPVREDVVTRYPVVAKRQRSIHQEGSPSSDCPTKHLGRRVEFEKFWI